MKSMLRLFVYGTLKKGFSNHDRYCAGVSRIESARLRGRLLKLAPDIPVMIVPDSEILAMGSGNITADVRLLEEFEPAAKAMNADVTGNAAEQAEIWKEINGELHVFDDPERRLPLMDGLEEFRHGEQSTYIRVLVRVLLARGSYTTAWAYVAGFDTADLESYEGETWFPD